MKKDSKKLSKKLSKLEKKLYSDIKYIPKEDMLLSKLSESVRTYYELLPKERRQSFLSYIVRKEEREDLEHLSGLKMRKDKSADDIPPKKCSNLSEVLEDRKKRSSKKYRNKRKLKGILKRKDGLFMLMNPDTYDHTLLSKKKYRKYLAKLAKTEKKDSSVLDCTLSNFKEELMSNPNINNAVLESFAMKYNL